MSRYSLVQTERASSSTEARRDNWTTVKQMSPIQSGLYFMFYNVVRLLLILVSSLAEPVHLGMFTLELSLGDNTILTKGHAGCFIETQHTDV